MSTDESFSNASLLSLSSETTTLFSDMVKNVPSLGAERSKHCLVFFFAFDLIPSLAAGFFWTTLREETLTFSVLGDQRPQLLVGLRFYYWSRESDS